MKLISVKIEFISKLKAKIQALNKIQKISLVVASVLLLTSVVVAVVVSAIKPPDITSSNTVVHVDEITGEEFEIVVDSTKTGDIYTFLFAGRDYAGLNTDTIMVASFDTNDYTVNIMSIPRDTMSKSVSRSVPKINAAYGVTGKANPDNLKFEVEQFLGFEIDRYAVINLDVFVELIDLIGGVTIDVPRRMYYTDPTQNLYIDIQPGLQTLNGNDAMGFVRYRSGYASGDIGRIEAQQLFIKALADTVLKPSIITKISSIISTVYDNVDTDFSITELVWFATEALNIDLSTGVEIMTLPGVDGSAYSTATGTNLSYYFANQTDLLEILNEKFNPTTEVITASDINIAIKSEQYVKSTTVTESANTDATQTEDNSSSTNDSTSSGSSSNSSSQTTSPDISESDEEDFEIEDLETEGMEDIPNDDSDEDTGEEILPEDTEQDAEIPSESVPETTPETTPLETPEVAPETNSEPTVEVSVNTESETQTEE